jgi:hypothetical protein
VSQGNGISAFDADDNSLSRIVYLDLDEVIIELMQNLSPTIDPANSNSSGIRCPPCSLRLLSVQSQRGVPLGGWSRSRGDAAATAVQDATAMARRAKR